MNTYIIKVKKTKGFDYLEYDNYPLVDGYYVRCDIIEKKGNKLRLIEVKAKSFDPTNDFLFIGKNII